MSSDQMISLAHSLGQKNPFNSLTQPEDPTTQALPDIEALERCLDLWNSEGAEMRSSEELRKCVLKARLTEIATREQDWRDALCACALG